VQWHAEEGAKGAPASGIQPMGIRKAQKTFRNWMIKGKNRIFGMKNEINFEFRVNDL